MSWVGVSQKSQLNLNDLGREALHHLLVENYQKELERIALSVFRL
jgi:hypothetical protein